MNAILDFMSPTKWIIAGVLALALITSVLGYGEWRAHQATKATEQRYELAIGRLKTEAASKLSDETREVLRLERALSTMTQELEKLNAQRQKDTLAAERRLADAAARNGGRQRDPHATGCGGGSGGPEKAVAAGAAAGAGDGAGTSGLLSGQLSGLLQRLQQRADAINDAYAICRQDAINIRTPDDQLLQLSPSP